MPRLASPIIYCKNPRCGQPLIEIAVNSHYRICCDNVNCYLYREGQGNRARKQGQKPPPVKKVIDFSRTLRPTYLASLEKRKEIYHFARSLRFGSVEAMRLRGKSKKEIEKLAGIY